MSRVPTGKRVTLRTRAGRPPRSSLKCGLSSSHCLGRDRPENSRAQLGDQLHFSGAMVPCPVVDTSCATVALRTWVRPLRARALEAQMIERCAGAVLTFDARAPCPEWFSQLCLEHFGHTQGHTR